ncbi:hypothetical protein XENTR_v10008714 [Xenopus tropicalis]|nr:hypothetical protein XENTR_v10008714 [Xenopus tropicalis]
MKHLLKFFCLLHKTGIHLFFFIGSSNLKGYHLCYIQLPKNVVLFSCHVVVQLFQLISKGRLNCMYICRYTVYICMHNII